ncbi:MAG: Gldg family protein [Ignavibacteriaceae bacterium]|jgi:ABC-type uncharacterized transport system.|nr:MAG: hypothetical protein EDM69_09705 [Chlorobiota bacterium]KXK03168.1 MAG: ABC-type uncharacterized transport system [Chlorobi bacterium OLB4]MBV6399627.1 hypothetical protein [Ignavibacteria bacterium]MCC6886344.1 Gldg family protein [Ignavibacteriales bacterium]MCE7953783.1 hypothetical protein [Chlorobi bacterium CHB7]MDL1887717.1 hypothetical protein [Ignavibacteria bacterium CHB1]MEB2330284.1 Gldg family protein [Ignavibacteriaceae bacterium]OQY76830.1 MAG: hypothetical protein B6D
MKRKDLKKQTIIKTALIIGIIVLLNVLGMRFFTRVDLTKNQTYTLSQVSKDLVGNLQDNLVIKAYFSDNLPAPYNNLRRQVRDILDDYRTYSNGYLNYEFYNPIGESGEADLQKEAQKYGINPVQVQVVDKDKLEVKNAFLGLVLLYGGKQEALPLIQSIDNFEFELTTAILRITNEKQKKIGYLQGQEEYAINSFETLNSILTKQYELVPVNVSLNNPVPEDIELLVVAGPKKDFELDRMYLIDQYIMRGGKVIWLLNKVIPNFQQQVIIGDQVNLNIEQMMQHYGLKVNMNLVRDLQCAQVTVQSPIGIPISVNYPYFPLVTNINRDITAFNNIKSVTLSFASSVDIPYGESKGLKVTKLLSSSDRSGIAEGFFVLNLEQFQNLNQNAIDTLFDKADIPVGAIYEGNFTSYFEGKPIPHDTVPGSRQDTLEFMPRTSAETKMIAIGDAEFINEQNRPPTENFIFFANMVDYLMDDVGMSDIRNKISSEAPIEEVTDETKNFIKYFSLIFPPAVVMLIGLYIWNKRSTRRRNLKTDFKEKEISNDEE